MTGGKTASALAAAKPTTIAALNQAIAAAGTDVAGIHAAVRQVKLDELRLLAADATLRESRDKPGANPAIACAPIGKLARGSGAAARWFGNLGNARQVLAACRYGLCWRARHRGGFRCAHVEWNARRYPR